MVVKIVKGSVKFNKKKCGMFDCIFMKGRGCGVLK
jgi:hypothetical protein